MDDNYLAHIEDGKVVGDLADKGDKGKGCRTDSTLRPRALPMGFTWSPSFCQSMTESVSARDQADKGDKGKGGREEQGGGGPTPQEGE